MTDAKLKSLAERIENLMDERDGIQSDIRDIFTEAKSAGYVPKVLRKAITRKRMDPSKRNEEDAILELYEGALDGKTRAVRAEIAKGATLDATAEKTGVPRRTVARIAETVPENQKVGTKPPHDPETGVIIEDAAPQTLGDASAPVAEPVHSSACPPQPLSEGGDGIGHLFKEVAHEPGLSLAPQDDGAPAEPGPSNHVVPAADNSAHEIAPTPSVGAIAEPSAATWQQIVAGRDAFETEREAAREAERARRRAEHAKAAARNAEIDADPLTIPPFLRKQIAASVT